MLGIEDRCAGNLVDARAHAAGVLVEARDSDQQAFNRSGPAQVGAVLQTSEPGEVCAELSQKIGVAAMQAVGAVTRVYGVREVAEFVAQGEGAVNVATEVRDGGVAHVGGVDALREEREGVDEVKVLRIVVEAESGFYLASADSEPALEFVVAESPIQFRVPVAQLTQATVESLRTHPEFIRDLRRSVESSFGELAASHMAGVHGEPVVVVGMHEALGCIAVKLNFSVPKLELLRPRQRNQGEEDERHLDSSAHVFSLR
jgi:hypothetical protein